MLFLPLVGFKRILFSRIFSLVGFKRIGIFSFTGFKRILHSGISFCSGVVGAIPEFRASGNALVVLCPLIPGTSGKAPGSGSRGLRDFRIWGV